MTAKEHNRLVGIFLMAHGGMQAILLAIVSFVYGLMAVAALSGGRGQQRFVGLFFVVMLALMLIFSVVFAGSQILGGYKLFKERPNARIWGIIGSIVSCLSFPLGTAAGVYGLWFLFGDMGKQMYMKKDMLHNMFQPQQYVDEGVQPQYHKPPPPNSWQ